MAVTLPLTKIDKSIISYPTLSPQVILSQTAKVKKMNQQILHKIKDTGSTQTSTKGLLTHNEIGDLNTIEIIDTIVPRNTVINIEKIIILRIVKTRVSTLTAG